jgi:hypothetical protein
MQITPIVDNWSARSRINVESTLYFDGIKHKVDLGRSYNETFTNQASWSLSFFSTKASYPNTIIGNDDYDNAGFFIQELTDTQRRYFFRGSSFNNTVDVETYVNHESFFHNCVVYDHDNTTLSIFSNSREIHIDSGITLADIQNTTWNLEIGNWTGETNWPGATDPTWFYNGNLAHVAFFNSALTAGDVRHIFENGGNINNKNHANCVGYWPLTHRNGYRKKVKY